jgi:hypothetical protein
MGQGKVHKCGVAKDMILRRKRSGLGIFLATARGENCPNAQYPRAKKQYAGGCSYGGMADCNGAIAHLSGLKDEQTKAKFQKIDLLL